MSKAIDALRVAWTEVTREHPEITLMGAEAETEDEQTVNVMIIRGLKLFDLDDDHVVVVSVVNANWANTMQRILNRMYRRILSKQQQMQLLEKEVFSDGAGFVDDPDSPGEASS